MTPKEMLERALAGTKGRTPQPITDEFSTAIAKRLEARRIVKVPGLEDEPEPEMEWYEKWIELNRRHEEFEREREARKEAEQEASTAPQSTAGIVREAISASTGSTGHIPLNGMAVLKAALAGMGTEGTINGGPPE